MFTGKPSPFFQGAKFRVHKQGVAHKSPKIEIDDEAIFLALKLAKAGYMGGDPQKVLSADTNIVIDMIHFEGFENDLVEAYRGMGQE